MSTYVYAVTGSAHPRPIDGLTGVGPQAPPLRVVRHDDLAAVVSDAPGSLRAKRRDLESHHGILAALSEVGPVLPMRFGTLAPDDAAVQSRLAAGRDRYRELLSRVEGKVELNVKAAHREDAVLREMLLAHPTLLARHEALRGSGGGSYEAKVAFGARLMAALEERRARDAEQVLATLGPHAWLTRPAPPVDGCFVNASFLVGAAGRRDFEASLAKLQHELATLAVVRVYGPLPPYSFVAIDEANG